MRGRPTGTATRQIPKIEALRRDCRDLEISDVTATDDPELQEAELMVLRKGFARVLSADEIRRRLRGAP